MAPATRICVAQIGAPHGVRGEVRLKAFTEDPLALRDYGPLESEDGGRTFEVVSLRPAREMLVVRLRGVEDRNAAEALRNLRLYVARERLAPADEDEFYHADLIGLRAVDPAGRELGTVIAVQNFGAGDLLEIARERGLTVLVPFTKAAAPTIDVAAERIVVDAPDLFEAPLPSPPVGERGEDRPAPPAPLEGRSSAQRSGGG